jgi:hypothetical protein
MTKPWPGAEEIMASAVPLFPMESGIYFLIRDGRVSYVGQATMVGRRVASHVPAKVFDSWAWVPCPAWELNLIERAYIDMFLPEDNMDQITRNRRGDVPTSRPAPDRASDNPFQSITETQRAYAREQNDNSIMKERMQRLRALKASYQRSGV